MENTINNRKESIRVALIGIFINVGLAVFKISAGILGNSFALVADGIESSADIISSLVVIMGLVIASKPPDKEHPYGHGKAESLAGLIVSLALIFAAIFIAWNSIKEIRNPEALPPHWLTLAALIIVIVVKEWLFRLVNKQGQSDNSTALKSDAWHHRSDAITSAACFIGILIAVIGGTKYAGADDWAALVACLIIGYNGWTLMIPALQEIMDGAVPEPEANPFHKIAVSVEGVLFVEKFRLRKSGIEYQADIHAQVDPLISVVEGHNIAHKLRNALTTYDPRLTDISVHIEPYFKEEHLMNTHHIEKQEKLT